MGIALLATAVKGISPSPALPQGLQSQRSVLVQVSIRVRATIASLTQRQDSLCSKGRVTVRQAAGVKVIAVFHQCKSEPYR